MASEISIIRVVPFGLRRRSRVRYAEKIMAKTPTAGANKRSQFKDVFPRLQGSYWRYLQKQGLSSATVNPKKNLKRIDIKAFLVNPPDKIANYNKTKCQQYVTVTGNRSAL